MDKVSNWIDENQDFLEKSGKNKNQLLSFSENFCKSKRKRMRMHKYKDLLQILKSKDYDIKTKMIEQRIESDI